MANIGCSDLLEICNRRNIKNRAFRRSTKMHHSGTSKTCVREIARLEISHRYLFGDVWHRLMVEPDDKTLDAI